MGFLFSLFKVPHGLILHGESEYPGCESGCRHDKAVLLAVFSDRDGCAGEKYEAIRRVTACWNCCWRK